MLTFKRLQLTFVSLIFSLITQAGTPVNGTTSFSSVSEGPKATGNAGAGAGITANDIQGFNFNLTTGVSGPTMVIEVWDGFVSSGNGVAFYESTSTINPLFSGIKITANDGAFFDLLSIGINAQSSGGGNTTVTIIGLDISGNTVSGATATGLASVSALTNFNVSGNNAFKGIAGIRITSSDMVYAFIDNINLANVGTVLPVSWLDFSAHASGDNVTLNWSTATEQNSKDFIIQQSSNGTNWKNVGITIAAGNSTNVKHYYYIHNTPDDGANYYRIIQQDINGKLYYSNVINVSIRNKSTRLSVYPSVVVNGFIYVKLAERKTVHVFNNAGSLVITKKLQQGVNQLLTDRMPKGVYYIKAGEETGSFIIQ